jgi:hypothetical protein
MTRQEQECRDFLGDETWKRWKTDYDTLMAFRKTLKGKPTPEQRLILEMNNAFISFYGVVLSKNKADKTKADKT